MSAGLASKTVDLSVMPRQLFGIQDVLIRAELLLTFTGWAVVYSSQ